MNMTDISWLMAERNLLIRILLGTGDKRDLTGK